MLQAGKQILHVGRNGNEPVNGGFQLRFIAGSCLCGLMLDIALALDLAGDDNRQAMLFADTVAGAADEVIAALVGMVVLMIRKADRIENQVVMDMPLVNVGGIEKSYLDSDTAKRLHLLLHNLDEPYKEIFTLRVFGDLPFSQIGELFGKTDSWARLIFYRAKKQLQEEMQ